MALVELTKVSKRYGDVLAVEEVNLTTTEGEFVVLVGPSGCGKTTTMRMIAGLETVTTGEIKIGGKNVVGMIPRERDVAMVFQNYALFPPILISPVVTVSNPAIIRMVVVFPQPEGPTRTTNSPSVVVRLTSSTAKTSPYRLLTFVSSTRAISFR